MDLSTYLREQRLTLDAFAGLLATSGVSVTGVSVHRWAKKKAKPSIPHAQAIERVTEGKVTVAALLPEMAAALRGQAA